CRNVLIYFDKELQNRVFHLFDASLEPLGFLAAGSKETLKFSDINFRYKQQGKEKIWKKQR
ncbi:MAG TPA: CheR family methyltransferase, partial [Chitinophagaceae bacterium]|nr:CheR family methyltransferase [Chitinophagaceae bacterium]